MSENSNSAKPASRSFADYLTMFFALVTFLFCFVPFGGLALIGGRLIYGSWHDAWFIYVLSIFSGLLSIVGTVPIIGVGIHWWMSNNWLLPWVASHGVRASWLTETLAASGSVIASLCWAALNFRLAEAKVGRDDGTAEELRRLGLPMLEARRSGNGRRRLTFWSNIIVVVAGLALVAWLYRSVPAYALVAACLAFSAFAIVKGPASKSPAP